jgi:hypothetical protein
MGTGDSYLARLPQMRFEVDMDLGRGADGSPRTIHMKYEAPANANIERMLEELNRKQAELAADFAKEQMPDHGARGALEEMRMT